METNPTDPRLKLLSYSSLLTLHACPRKYQLYRLKATEDISSPMAAINQNITFAFGHVVGDGVQRIMAGQSEDKVIFQMFLDWHADLEDRDEKRNKNFYLAIAAVQRFISMRNSGLFDEWEVLIYNGKPACELSFSIEFPDGYRMRGSVDCVLRHKVTGKVRVLELKTSSSVNLNPTGYKNSAQGIGYSVVLDVICPDITSYEVIYLVYLTKGMHYEMFTFPKTYLQRATWIQELLLDIETIKLYDSTGVYPMRGESCSDWGRDCEYLNQCTLTTGLITTPYIAAKHEDKKVYDVKLTLMDLINAQMDRVAGSSSEEDTIEDGSINYNLLGDVIL